MDLQAAEELAHRLLVEHRVAARGWTFGFNRRKRSLGLCNYALKRVELSAYFVALNEASRVHDTLLHEIAHALAGHRAGHGPAWVAACRHVGRLGGLNPTSAISDSAQVSRRGLPAGGLRGWCCGVGLRWAHAKS